MVDWGRAARLARGELAEVRHRLAAAEQALAAAQATMAGAETQVASALAGVAVAEQALAAARAERELAWQARERAAAEVVPLRRRVSELSDHIARLPGSGHEQPQPAPQSRG